MILFIDDGDVFEELYVQTLREAGFAVEFCTDVGKALEFVRGPRGSEVRLVILDTWLTPGETYRGRDYGHSGERTGLLVLEDLRALPAYRTTPVIFFTLSREVQWLDGLSRRNGVKVFQKRAVLPSELVVIVRDLLAPAPPKR